MPEQPKKRVAIIPARGGSKRLPKKNILPLGGRPIIHYPIEAALKSGLFDKVIVSSDSDEIISIAREAGAETIKRPDELATDTINELDSVAYTLETLKRENDYESEFFCVVYPTAAFVEAEDLRQAYTLFEQAPKPDVVMSVSEYKIHPYKALAIQDDGYWSALFPEECKMRSQFYPTCVSSNGTFYWFRTSNFANDRAYYTKKLQTYILPAHKAFDIDTLNDYEFVKKFYDVHMLKS